MSEQIQIHHQHVRNEQTERQIEEDAAAVAAQDFETAQDVRAEARAISANTDVLLARIAFLAA